MVILGGLDEIPNSYEVTLKQFEKWRWLVALNSLEQIWKGKESLWWRNVAAGRGLRSSRAPPVADHFSEKIAMHDKCRFYPKKSKVVE